MNITPRVVSAVVVTIAAAGSLLACSNDDSSSAGDAGAPVDATSLVDATTHDAQPADAAPLAPGAEAGPSDAGPGDADAAGDGSTGSTACTPDAGRCTGQPAVNAERCDSTGAWQAEGTCPYQCLAGACVGECGAGSTQCCEVDDFGNASCGNDFLQACISGTTCLTPHPRSIVVRTCSAAGTWEETSTCGEACAPDPDDVIVGCSVCSGTAVCLGNVSGACQCPMH